MTDEYAASGEFIDLLISPFWEALGPALATALANLDVRDGPVVDLGAGSGHGTLAVAEALPEAEIVAVEPSLPMRAVLLSRLSAHPRLRTAVTVIPDPFPRAVLPERVSAVVAMNVLGHFAPADRRTLWRLLEERLSPGGRAVVNLQPPAQAVEVPETPTSVVHVGRRRYEGSGRAEPAGEERVTWRMTYRTFQDDVLVDETRVDYGWWVLDEARLREEVAAHGFELHAAGADELDLHVISRR